MSLAVLRSRALSGMLAPEVTVEVHLANGLPSFAIIYPITPNPLFLLISRTCVGYFALRIISIFAKY